MYTVKFTKEFVDGNLKGIFYDTQLDFPSLESATSYVAFLHAHKTKPVDTVGGSRYVCHLARIERE